MWVFDHRLSSSSYSRDLRTSKPRKRRRKIYTVKRYMLLETYRVNVFEGNDSRIRKKKYIILQLFTNLFSLNLQRESFHKDFED